MSPNQRRTRLSQQEKLGAVILYCKGGWKQDELAAEFGVTKGAISQIVKETIASTNDHSVTGLLLAPYLRPTVSTTRREEHRGAKPRIQPGSRLASMIRTDAIGRYRSLDPCTAANNTIDDCIEAGVLTEAELVQHELKGHCNRRVLGETSTNARERRYRSRVRWIDRRQVFAIRTEPIYYMADRPEQQRPIVHKRSIIKERGFSIDSRARWHGDLWDIMRSDGVVIGVDEVFINLTGNDQLHISCLEGDNPYNTEAPTGIRLMQWAALCGDYPQIERPITIWELESEELVSELASKLQKQQDKLDSWCQYQWQQASIEGTYQHTKLYEKNHQIKVHNEGQKVVNNSKGTHASKGTKRYFTAQRLWPRETFTRDNAKGGLDFVWYAFEVYEKLLFPYYEKVREASQGKRPVFIVEDNVGIHGKARRLLRLEIEERGIQFKVPPTNSADLLPIEQGHFHEDRLLDPLRAALHKQGSNQPMKAKARSEVITLWQGPAMSEIISQVAKTSDYMELAMRASFVGFTTSFHDQIHLHN